MRINYKELLKKEKNKKFQLLKELKENDLIICAFHPSEGCGDCRYFFRCTIKGG